MYSVIMVKSMRSLSADVPTEASSTQGFLLNLFGLFVFDHPRRDTVPTSLAVKALEGLGISENATRTTLGRMVNRGLLVRERQGRTASFGLTDEARGLLARGRDRVFAATPFDHGEAGWTLLNVGASALRGNARYHFDARLSWAGFAPLDSRLWIAPGRIDIPELLADMLSPGAIDDLNVFNAVFAPPSSPDRIVSRVWDLPGIRRAHERFLAVWERHSHRGERPLPALIRLAEDWSRLLRTDPGLPGAALDSGWPADRSTLTFHRLFDVLKPAAEAEFESLEKGAP